MKGFDLELNDLFDIEGFLAFIILVFTTFLVYYSTAFSDVSNRHEDNIAKPVNATVNASTKTNSLLYPSSSENSQNKTGQLEFSLRVPKYVASFNDTTMELTITNPLEINQSGRFFIVDEIRPLTGETNFKHISFSIDGKKTNQSDFSIPPYARQTFTVNLNAPRNIEGNIATLRLGLLGCNDNEICNQYGDNKFLSWTSNNSCKTTDTKKNTPTETKSPTKGTESPAKETETPSEVTQLSGEFICVSIDTAQAIQFSAREQILLSPWSNIFLPALVFLVTYIVDHTFLRKIRSKSTDQKFQTGRFWKLLIISAVIIFIILFLLIKEDIVLALEVVIPVILLIVLAHTFPFNKVIRGKPCNDCCKVCGKKLEASNKECEDKNVNNSEKFFNKIWKSLTKQMRSDLSHLDAFKMYAEKLHQNIKEYRESIENKDKTAKVDEIVSMVADICEKRRQCMECDEASNQEACSLEVKRINEVIYPRLPEILNSLTLPLRYKLVSTFLVLDPQNYIYQEATKSQLIVLLPDTDKKVDDNQKGVDTNFPTEVEPNLPTDAEAQKPIGS